MRQRLSQQDVSEIVSLYREGWGKRNISDMTDIPEKTVEKVLQGKAYVRFTGGRICNGKRPASELRIYA